MHVMFGTQNLTVRCLAHVQVAPVGSFDLFLTRDMGNAFYFLSLDM
jgi:hypothetical protein